MIARIQTGTLLGVDALTVDVEAELGLGLPHFQIVGMGDRAVAESRHRVRAAIRNTGFSFPTRRLTVNLAPADLRKDGASFDLPIAVALLVASDDVRPASARRFFFAGELALDGSLRPIPGALPLAMRARELGLDGVFLPRENAQEAAVLPGIEVLGCRTLVEVVQHLRGEQAVEPLGPPEPESNVYAVDLADIRGQVEARFALEVAAAGGHNLLLVGPPGTGKTMLARRLPTILPELAFAEALEVTRVWSVAGKLRGRSLLRRPPFCAPHHTVSGAGLIGAASPPAPGDATLAHRGVLFLDELPEFRRSVLESLREPLEEGEIALRRAHVNLVYPARFQLVATMNPCPCGRYSSVSVAGCTCDPDAIARYRARLSGPLLDRIDMHVEVPALPARELAGEGGERSSVVRERVVAARARAAHRHRSIEGMGTSLTNAAVPPGLLQQASCASKDALSYLATLVEGFALSARAFDRLLRVARTIADLSDHAELEVEHILRATSCRALDQTIS